MSKSALKRIIVKAAITARRERRRISIADKRRLGIKF
jgi:hypothetical protein